MTGRVPVFSLSFAGLTIYDTALTDLIQFNLMTISIQRLPIIIGGPPGINPAPIIILVSPWEQSSRARTGVVVFPSTACTSTAKRRVSFPFPSILGGKTTDSKQKIICRSGQNESGV
ncbi:hypothetical protein OIU76_030460 [Salix suchowensis]|nr:hypothetical protein OIU76_030460 [Salix suchowensis]KAJ6369164.1 hypothetical protein OIU78_001513 [Salix suchowensis]